MKDTAFLYLNLVTNYDPKFSKFWLLFLGSESLFLVATPPHRTTTVPRALIEKDLKTYSSLSGSLQVPTASCSAHYLHCHEQHTEPQFLVRVLRFLYPKTKSLSIICIVFLKKLFHRKKLRKLYIDMSNKYRSFSLTISASCCSHSLSGAAILNSKLEFLSLT